MSDTQIQAEDLTEFQAELLHGRCHLFALALHEISGHPIGAYLEWDNDVEAMSLVHAFVVIEDRAVDVRGMFAIDDILEGEFETTDADFVHLSPKDLMSLADGRRKIPPNDPHYEQAKAEAHRALASLLPSPGHSFG